MIGTVVWINYNYLLFCCVLGYVYRWKNKRWNYWALITIDHYDTKLIVCKGHISNLDCYLKRRITFRNRQTLNCVGSVQLVPPFKIHLEVNIIWAHRTFEKLYNIWYSSNRAPGHYRSWDRVHINLFNCRWDIWILTKLFRKWVFLARRWIRKWLA